VGLNQWYQLGILVIFHCLGQPAGRRAVFHVAAAVPAPAQVRAFPAFLGPKTLLTLPYLRPSSCVEAHWAVQSLHSERSFVRSRASSHVRPNKSKTFFTVEVHDTLGRPLFLLKCGRVQSIACRAILLESIWYMWPNHLSRHSLMIDSKVSCPVLSRTVLFVIMSFQLIFILVVTWPCSCLTLHHVNWNSFIIILIIIIDTSTKFNSFRQQDFTEKKVL